MRVYRNDWKTYAKKHLFISILIILCYPITFLLLEITYPTAPPDRPIELFAWGLIYASLFLAMVVFPAIYLCLYMYRKKRAEIEYYKPVDNGFIYITAGFIKYDVNFEDIKIIICPNPKGSKWEEDTQFGTLFYKNRHCTLDMKSSYRILFHYLIGGRKNPDKFKAIILIGYGKNREDIWKATNALKKSAKYPEEWDRFLEEFWSRRDKEFWLTAPLEDILERINCPYTLEELENPSEDEYVEIDESKIREDVC